MNEGERTAIRRRRKVSKLPTVIVVLRQRFDLLYERRNLERPIEQLIDEFYPWGSDERSGTYYVIEDRPYLSRLMSYVRARARAAGDRGGALSVRALSLTTCGCMGKGVMARRPLELQRGSIVLRALHEHGKVSRRRFEHTVDLTKIANRFIAPGSVLLLSHFDARLWYLKRRRQDVLQRSVDHTVDRFRIGELVIVDAVPVRTTKPSSRLAASSINTRVVSLDCSKELKHLPRIHRHDNSAGVSPCVAANGLRLFLRNEHICVQRTVRVGGCLNGRRLRRHQSCARIDSPTKFFRRSTILRIDGEVAIP